MNEQNESNSNNAYLMALVFLLIAASSLLLLSGSRLLSSPGPGGPGNSSSYGMFVLYAAIVVGGAALVRIKKNDMTGAMFVAYGALGLIITFAAMMYTALTGNMPEQVIQPTMGICLIVLSVVEAMTSNKNRFALIAIMMLTACKYLLNFAIDDRNIMDYCMVAFEVVTIVLSLYFALALICERYSLPYSESLKAEDTTEFRNCGSMIGYIIIALMMSVDVLFDITGSPELGQVVTIKIFGGIFLILVAILLRTSGRMRYTPLVFAAIGIIILLGGIEANAFVGGVFTRSPMVFYALGALAVFLGVLTLLRNDRRILMALLCFVIGACYMSYGPGNIDVVGGILAAVSVAIAVYLAFAVSVDKIKLPLV